MYRTSPTFKKNKIYSKDLDIVVIQNQRNKLRYKAYSKRTRSAWVAYRKVRKEIKQKINTTKTSCYKNIFNSKSTKDIWNVIHRIFNPKSAILEGNINDINKLFISASARATGKNRQERDVYRTITSLPGK